MQRKAILFVFTLWLVFIATAHSYAKELGHDSEDVNDVECCAVVMNDNPDGYRYPARVRFEVDQMSLASHSLAADFLNMNNFDVVCLQHELLSVQMPERCIQYDGKAYPKYVGYHKV